MQGKVYTQMYSLMRTSPDGLLDYLKKVSEIGWDGIEAMGVNTGGLSVEEFKAYMKELKLDIISFHALRDEGDMAIAQELGGRFTDLRLPHVSDRESVIVAAQELNKEGQLRAKYGMKAVVHNHADEFYWVAGEENKTRIYDLLMEYTDPELVGFELDLGWAQRAGIDVVEYIKKYAGRFPLLHVKECNAIGKDRSEMDHFPQYILDMKDESQDDRKFIKGAPKFSPKQIEALYASRQWNVELGKGLLKWDEIVAAAEAQGVQAYINEREYYHIAGIQGDPVECSKVDYAFLRSL